MTHEETQERIDVNYNNCVEDVFRDATIHMLQVESQPLFTPPCHWGVARGQRYLLGFLISLFPGLLEI
jgi:hypothetical protein